MSEDALKIKIVDKLLPFFNEAIRYKIAFGGRGGLKSQTCIDILIHKAHVEGKRVCVFREFGESIENSVWALIVSEIERMQVPGFTIGKRNIDCESGGGFRSKGIGRDSKGVKSYSGFDYFLIEEGDFLTDEILKDLRPTLRKEGSEVWLIFNPQSREDTVSKNFLLPYYDELLKNGFYKDENHYIIWTSMDDNPWAPTVLLQEREIDKQKVKSGLMSQQEYDHIWNGYFNDTVPNAIIKQEWFEAAIDAHKKIKGFEPRGVQVVAHDPSDLGPDDKALTHRHGSVVLECLTKSDGDYNDGAEWSLKYAIDNNVDLYVWDAIGNSLHQQVKSALSGKRIDYSMFKGSEAVDWPDVVYEGELSDRSKRKTHKETWKNKRAQKAGLLADRFFKTYLAVEKGIWTDPDEMISISSNIEELEELRAETCRIPKKPNNNGLFQLYTKEEMKNKFKIKSPNRFDSLYMAFEDTTSTDETITDIDFDGWGT